MSGSGWNRQNATSTKSHVNVVGYLARGDGHGLVETEAGAVVVPGLDVREDGHEESRLALLLRQHPSQRLAEAANVFDERHILPVFLGEALHYLALAGAPACATDNRRSFSRSRSASTISSRQTVFSEPVS